MNNLQTRIQQLTPEKKAQLLEQLQNNGASDTPSDIPEAFYKFEKFPEYEAFNQAYGALAEANLENPFFRVNEGVVAATTQIEGKELINYSSFNYLSYSGDERVAQKAKACIDTYGTSAGASRLVTGERPLHRELESAIAEMIGTPDAIVFPHGHSTNVNTVGHLFRDKDLIIHDVLIHNSIEVGCKLSGAAHLPFPHNDFQALDDILKSNRGQYERVLIAIEGVYSMDGDIADIPRFIEIKNKYKAMLLVDEAHSVGVIGKHGRGVSEYFNLDASDVEIWMGTISKALGSSGGYIAGQKEMIHYLKYTAPGFVYSTGISPADAGAALAAIQTMQSEPERLERLHSNAELFLKLCQKHNINTAEAGGTGIVPVIVGEPGPCIQLANTMYEHAINVQPILYPVVPRDACRLRFLLNSEHTEEQIRYTVEILVQELAK